jgi:hypothetical protein
MLFAAFHLFASDEAPTRSEIEKAIWSRRATQMRIEWPDGKRQVVEIFDCWNDQSSLASIPVENARRIWVRNFRPYDCMVMGVAQPNLLRFAKPELIWREVWKRSGVRQH